MIRRLSLLLALGCAALPPAPPLAAQPYPSYPAFAAALDAAAALADADARDAAVDEVWGRVVENGQIPFTDGTTAAFLHRGAAGAVAARGDHNSWGSAGTGPLAQVGLSDVWRRVETLPADARVDYKLVVDGNWRLDPHNPHQQWGGFGPNSELRMPAWAPSPETVRADGVPAGTYGQAAVLASARLGYGVRYRVWTPAGYEADPSAAGFPVLFVTDGHEYADDRLGAALPVLDNLVAEGRIAPPIVVFVDPRDPVTGENRRQAQYLSNPDFAAFLADELAPALDAAYRTAGTAETRGILGTSFGGVCALYLAAERPDAFGRIGAMSPALWAAPDLAGALAASTAEQTHFLSTGTLFDGADNTRAMRTVLENAGFALTYAERSEGHSWGQWRALMAPMLEALFPPAGSVQRETAPAGLEPLRRLAQPGARPRHAPAARPARRPAPARRLRRARPPRGAPPQRPRAGRLAPRRREPVGRRPVRSPPRHRRRRRHPSPRPLALAHAGSPSRRATRRASRSPRLRARRAHRIGPHARRPGADAARSGGARVRPRESCA